MLLRREFAFNRSQKQPPARNSRHGFPPILRSQWNWRTRHIDPSKYEGLELQYAHAEAKAVAAAQAEQKRLDAISTNAAQRKAATQAALTARVRQQLSEVQQHVRSLGPRGCVTYGLVRVLDAAVHGVIADSLALPAGKPDDACTGN